MHDEEGRSEMGEGTAIDSRVRGVVSAGGERVGEIGRCLRMGDKSIQGLARRPQAGPPTSDTKISYIFYGTSAPGYLATHPPLQFPCSPALTPVARYLPGAAKPTR